MYLPAAVQEQGGSATVHVAASLLADRLLNQKLHLDSGWILKFSISIQAGGLVYLKNSFQPSRRATPCHTSKWCETGVRSKGLIGLDFRRLTAKEPNHSSELHVGPLILREACDRMKSSFHGSDSCDQFIIKQCWLINVRLTSASAQVESIRCFSNNYSRAASGGRGSVRETFGGFSVLSNAISIWKVGVLLVLCSILVHFIMSLAHAHS